MSLLLEAGVNTLGAFPTTGLVDPLARFVGYAANQLWPNTLPSAGEIYDLWRAGILPARDAGLAINCLGARVPRSLQEFEAQPQREAQNAPWGSGAGMPKVWDAYWENRVQVPGPGDLLWLLNADWITRGQFDSLMKRQGWWNDDFREMLVRRAQNQMPSPAELVSFALREAWDAATVARFQYDAEFPPELRYWMERQGAGGDARIHQNGQPIGDPVYWPDLYWRVHWANISPTQSYEMFQRLREGRWQRYARDLPGLRGFTFADLQQVLKINDYPVPFRPQLAAIAYRRPRLVDIDRFYRNGSIDREEVLALHLDLGYSPPDAEMRTAWLESEQRKREFPVPKVNLVPGVLQLYRLGVATQLETVDRLMNAVSGGRYNRADQADVPERLRADFNSTVRIVSRLISDTDNRIAAQEAKEVVAALRRQFLRGQINEQDLRAAMIGAKFTNAAIDSYVRSWQRILQSGRLLLSTGKIRTLVIKQILPFAEAERMLGNLGWKDPEIRYILAELARDAELEQDRIEERMTRSSERREAARLRQATRLERERRRVVRTLNAQATPGQLHKYYTRSIINRRELETELQRRGFDDNEVKRRVNEAEIARQEYLARRAKQGFAAPNPGQFGPQAPSPAPGSANQPPAPAGSPAAPP